MELDGGWKKTYFKLVWDWLHVEQLWLKKDAANIPDDPVVELIKEKDRDDGSESDSGVGSDMEDMVKAVAT